MVFQERKNLLSLAVISVIGLAACQTSAPPSQKEARDEVILAPRLAASAPQLIESTVTGSNLNEKKADVAKQDNARTPYVSLGTGELTRKPQPRLPHPDAASGPPISLNLENGDLRELVRNVIVDTLGENVVLPPTLTGTITIRTPRPIPRAELLPTLETLLKGQGFALVKDGALWRVVPVAEAVAGNLTPKLKHREAQLGTNVVIYRVRYVGARELERIMKPFAKAPEQSIRVDDLRNMLFLTGTDRELANLIEVADMFDVDLFSGMSFVIYPLQYADAKTVLKEWTEIFQGVTAGAPGAVNPINGLYRLIPIERMNALLIISPYAEKIKEAQAVLQRLDVGNDAGGGARMYVYVLQYTQAEKLQSVLQQALSGRSGVAQTQATVAPGQQINNLSAPVNPMPSQPIVQPGNTSTNSPQIATAQQRVNTQVGAAQGGASLALARNATVIADKDRNALVVVATPSEYSAIESAIRQLDIPPKQVAIEIRIAQVDLTDGLSFGMATNFLGRPDLAINRLTSANGTGRTGVQGDAGSNVGFSYVWSNALLGGGTAGQIVKATLDTLQSKKQARSIASPVLVTLDNQKVTFTNGKQVSVQTQSSSGNTTSGVVNSFQYINTGLSITVTPRVSGQNVFLEIQQQNSDTSTPTGSNPNPDITQNSQTTSVVVASGDTMLLGGLFVEKNDYGTAGVPFLSSIPVIGGAFGQQNRSQQTSEVVMLITPTILEDAETARAKVDELRRKMENVETLLPKVSTQQLPTTAPSERVPAALRDAVLKHRGTDSLPPVGDKSVVKP